MNQRTDFAKKMRKNATDAEKLLWHHLRAKQFKGLKFRRQQPMGNYIVDFVCHENRLIIEADGGQHASALEKDVERTEWLNAQGYQVLRFWNNDILTNIDGVLESIRAFCVSPSS